MLIHWQSHQEYLNFLHETKIHLDSSQRTRLHLEFQAIQEKLRLLNLDPVMEYISSFYSHTGRPAKNQTQIIRSLVLMLMLGFTSLTAWVEKLRTDSLFAALAGSASPSLPPLGSYFDFIDRLWPQTKASQKTGRKDLFPADKNKKPSRKPGKGKKLPNKHTGITDLLADYAANHESFPFHYEERLQQFFRLAALIPSLKDDLIPAGGITLSGDGTCVHSHASPYGHKACKCHEKTMNPDIPIKDLCLDSAHDNYATYGLCRKWEIRPFIDLNQNRGRPESIPDSVTIDKDGTPLCMAGLRMVNWGYCKQKHARKWRCPLACGRTDSCPCREKCSSSSYGRCVYTRPD